MKKVLLFLLLIIIAFPVFSSYTLESLEALMLLNSTEIMKQDEVIEQAELDLKDAKANYSPQISATLAGIYMVNPIIGDIYINANDIYQVLPDTNIKIYDGMKNTLYMASLDITQPIFTWGKLSNAVKLYENILEIRNIEKSSIQSQKSVELEGYLAAVHYLSQILEEIDDALILADSLLEISRNGVETGVVLETDYLEQSLEKTQLEVQKKNIENNLSSVLESIMDLTGLEKLSAKDISYIPDESEFSILALLDRSSLKAKATSISNDNMKMASLAESSSELAVKIAKGSMYGKPDLALQVQLGYGGQLFPFLEQNWQKEDSWQLNFTIGLSTTLWDGGKILNNVKRSESQLRSASLDKENAKEEIESALNDAFSTFDLAMLNRKYYMDLDELYSRQLEILENNEMEGYSSSAEVLEKKVQIITNRISLASENLNALTSTLTIKYLTGIDLTKL